MSELTNQITIAISNLKEIGEHLYQQDTKIAYEKLNLTILELTSIMDSIYIYQEQQEEFQFDTSRLNLNLLEALKAMEAGDTVLLADILQ